MKKIVGVRFKRLGKIYFFDPKWLEVQKGEYIIVETTQGEDIAEVIIPGRMIDEEKLNTPLKKVLRLASSKDLKHAEDLKKKEKEAFEYCNKKIKEYKLDMTLTDVEYKFDNSKILFSFTSDGRVDFRELVKDLAATYKTRIELRQIGVRDEVKRIGGNGVCGRELCCCSFLGDFETVSIKMAKEQNLSLNPTKISGNCGRLMCCLKYEQEVYEEKEKTILTDVYSPVKNVINTTQTSVFHKLLVRNNSRCRASDRMNTGEYTNILQICNCTGVAQIDDITVEEDGLLVDGAIIANVFYVTANDAAPMGSIRAAVPFSNKIQVKSDEEITNMEYVVNAGVEQLSAAMTGSNEMEIKGSVGLDAICFAPCETESVMECEVEEYEENEFLKFPSIIGYIATGEETLWDIAKKYHTTVDSIKNGNHVLADRASERVKRGDKLLLVKAAR